VREGWCRRVGEDLGGLNGVLKFRVKGFGGFRNWGLRVKEGLEIEGEGFRRV
jgi:hypothetical protein